MNINLKFAIANLFVWLSVAVMFFDVQDLVGYISFFVFIIAMDRLIKYHNQMEQIQAATFGASFSLYMEFRQKVDEIRRLVNDGDVEGIKVVLNELEDILVPKKKSENMDIEISD